MFINSEEYHPLFKRKYEEQGNTAKASIIYQILSHQELLADKSFEFIIKNYEDLLVIPKENFNDVYQTTINNYAEYVQSLPNLKYTNFNFSKGQLFLALIRASITLRESSNFPCPNNSMQLTSQQIEKRSAIWKYAIFSSSLLLDLSHLITCTQVETCTEQGDNKLPWLPLDGAMTRAEIENTHYCNKNLNTDFNSTKNKLNLLIAHHIIPDYVLAWMYSEQDIFFEWLNVLDDQASGSGTLHKLIIVSVRSLINEYMGVVLPEQVLKLMPHHLKKDPAYRKDSFWKGVEFALRGEKGQPRQTEHSYGIDFVNWLRDGILAKSISINKPDSRIHISREGIFLLNPEIFLEFCRVNPRYSDWQRVYREFNQLGLTKYASEQATFEHSFANLKSGEIKRGLILKDPKYLFKNIKAPGVSPELTTEPLKPIKNSSVFPTPREEAGAFLRHLYNPGPEL